jgi:Fuseless
MKKEVRPAKASVCYDRQADLLDKFRGLKDRHKLLFAVLIGVGIVAFWRGMWMMMDTLFFPETPWISGVFSILLGLTILTASGVFLRMFEP